MNAQRDEQIESLCNEVHDVMIIGGGINGAVCAASLSAAGLKVALIEQGDFASVTSQESSNMIWGGIKYLQNGSFLLVHKLCKSRNLLIKNYPSTVRQIRYLTILQKSSPSRFLFFLGTWLYWILGKGFTKRPTLLSNSRVREEIGVKSIGGVEYSDAYLPDNDARFTFQFIRSAWQSGAIAVNYVKALTCQREGKIWRTTIENKTTGQQHEIQSQMIINAAGPMVDCFNQSNAITTINRIGFSKGVHLIVPKISAIEKVLTFIADDGRLFFALPMGKRTCIGTTDTRQTEWQSEVTIQDIEFILENINRQLNLTSPLLPSDVIATRCGVRPLVMKAGQKPHKDWTKMTRKHLTEVDYKNNFVTIFGGKLTDCLNVGNELRAICNLLGFPINAAPWYGEDTGKTQFLQQAAYLSQEIIDGIDTLAERLWRRYGNNARWILDYIKQDPTMAEETIQGSGVINAEAAYAARFEMVVTLEDFLRRRTSLALCERINDRGQLKALQKLAQLLFATQPEQKLAQYLNTLATRIAPSF